MAATRRQARRIVLDATAAPGSLRALGAQWVDWLRVRNQSPRTVTTRAEAFGLFVEWCAEREVTQTGVVTRAVVETYQRYLSRILVAAPQRRAGKPLSVRTQLVRLRTVALFFRWAVRRGHTPANPAADLDYPRPPASLPERLNVGEFEAVCSTCAATPLGIRDRAVLEVLFSTGLRRAELATLRTEDIDAERGLVRVVAGKGAKDRYVPIGPRALAWLARYDAQVRTHWCRDAGERTLFLSHRGAVLGRHSLGTVVKAALRAAGIIKVGSCHLFRHGMATEMVEAGCDIRTISAILGHDDLNSTAIYTRLGVTALRRAHALFHPTESCRTGGVEDIPAPAPDSSP